MPTIKHRINITISIIYGAYKGKTLEKHILPYLSKTSIGLTYNILTKREQETNLVRLSPKIAGLSFSQFKRGITPLFTQKVIVRKITPEPVNAEDKSEGLYLINPYLVIPMVTQEGILTLPSDAFEEWDKKYM